MFVNVHFDYIIFYSNVIMYLFHVVVNYIFKALWCCQFDNSFFNSLVVFVNFNKIVK